MTADVRTYLKTATATETNLDALGVVAVTARDDNVNGMWDAEILGRTISIACNFNLQPPKTTHDFTSAFRLVALTPAHATLTPMPLKMTLRANS